MMNEEEKQFVAWWSEQRLHKKKALRKLSIGLPLAVAMVMAIFANLFFGWYQRATMVLRKEEKSLVLVLIVAAILIVVFVVIFSARHRWDMNEQHYRELMAREKAD
jgi:formate hydrogenlyase subunit 4